MNKPKRKLQFSPNYIYNPFGKNRNPLNPGKKVIEQAPIKLDKSDLNPNLRGFMNKDKGRAYIDMAQQVMAEDAGSRFKQQNKKLTNADSTTKKFTSSSSTATTPQTTYLSTQTGAATSGTIPNQTSMPRRRTSNWNKSNAPETTPRQESKWTANPSILGITPTPSPFNSINDEKGIFVPEGTSSPIDYVFGIHSTLHTNGQELQIFPTTLTSGELLPKLHCNVANFYDKFLALPNNIDTASTASAFYINLNDIYWKTCDDVYRDARSNIYTSYNSVNVLSQTIGYTLQALEYLYCIDSIISYQPVDGQVNKALADLRNQFTTTALLQARFDLRTALIGKVIPPKLAELVRWYYQNYRFSENKFSACYRYFPSASFVNATPATAVANVISDINTPLTGIIANLNSTVNVQIGAILTKVYPWWQITNLPSSYNDTVYDYHHFEMFVNEPTMFDDLTATNAPSVYPCPATSTTDVPYYMLETPSNNGFAHLLQATWTGNGTGFQYANNADLTTSAGMRHCVSTASAGAFVSYRTNKFYFIGDTSNIFQPRIYDLPHLIAQTDAHKVSATNVINYAVSSAPLGFARVYYNNVQSLKVNFKLFFNYLFGLRA